MSIPYQPSPIDLALGDLYSLLFSFINSSGVFAAISYAQLTPAIIPLLTPGTMFSIKFASSDMKASLLSIDTTTSTCKLILERPITETVVSVSLLQWGQVTRTNTDWVTTTGVLEARSGLKATLLVNCSYTNTHEPGLIGWTLYKAINNVDVVVAKGNDSGRIGLLTVSKEGYLWTSGKYTLRAIRYSSVNMFPIQRAERVWVKSGSFSILAAGTLEDPYNPLAL